MDKLCETINRQCCLHCEMECDGKWLETEIEMYKEDLLKKQSDKIADLEAKLAESEETIRLLKMSNDALREDNLDLSYNQVDNVYQTATEMSKGWESQYQEEIAELKQQLEEKDAEVKSWKDGTMVVKLCELEKQLAEKDDLLKTYTQLNKDLTKRLDDRCDICIERHKQSQNQTAIEELDKLKEEFNGAFSISIQQEMFDKYIDQQIKSLKGDSR